MLCELPIQFNRDGSYYENSTGYHCFVLSALLLLKNNMSVGNDEFRRVLDMLLPKAIDFYRWCTVNHKWFLKVGDYDGAKFIVGPTLHEQTESPLYEKLSEYNPIDRPCTFKKRIDVPSVEYKYFEDFGLFIVRGINFYFALRTGSTGGKLTHAHYDYGSFSLYINGLPIWADKGNDSYNLSLNTRIYDRSSASHNGVFNEIEDNLGRFSDTMLYNFNVRHEIINGTLRVFFKIERNGINYYRDIIISADHFAIFDSNNVKPLEKQEYIYIDYGKKQNIAHPRSV